MKIGGEIEAAKLVKKVAPSYPESAKVAGVQGKVVLHAVIGMDGVPGYGNVVGRQTPVEVHRPGQGGESLRRPTGEPAR